MNWLNPKLSFREDRPFLEIIRAYAAQLHGHRELISRGIGWRLGVLSTQDVEAVLNLLVPESPQADESLYQKFTDGIRAIHAGGPTPLLLKQKLASTVGDAVEIDIDVLASELFDRELLAKWQAVNNIASGGLLILAWELSEPYRQNNSQDFLWQFFRHVRNAAGHDMMLNFKPGQPDKPARWRHLEMKAQMNRMPLFRYPPLDGLLSPGDCLYLLHDVEEQLMR